MNGDGGLLGVKIVDRSRLMWECERDKRTRRPIGMNREEAGKQKVGSMHSKRRKWKGGNEQTRIGRFLAPDDKGGGVTYQRRARCGYVCPTYRPTYPQSFPRGNSTENTALACRRYGKRCHGGTPTTGRRPEPATIGKFHHGRKMKNLRESAGYEERWILCAPVQSSRFEMRTR